MVKIAGIVVAFVVAIGVAFYGGTVYQNNSDQALFATYQPPKLTGRSGGATTSFFGGAASGGSQVAAALAVATPPISGGTLGSTGALTPTVTQPATGPGVADPAATPAAGSAGPSGSGSPPSSSESGSGTATAGATATDVAGTLQSIDGQSVKLKTTTGAAQTVVVGPATTYYVATAAQPAALKVGRKVTVSLQRDASGSFGAGSITIAPSGTLFAYLRSATARTAGRPGGDASSGAGSSGAPGGGGGGGFGGRGAGGFGGFAVAGAITAVSGSSVTVQTTAGRAQTVPITSSTLIYQLQAVAAAKLASGATVSVHATPASGKLVAQNVVASNVQGMVASLTTERVRRGFAGGSGGGGFGGGGFSGGNGANGGSQGG